MKSAGIIVNLLSPLCHSCKSVVANPYLPLCNECIMKLETFLADWSLQSAVEGAVITCGRYRGELSSLIVKYKKGKEPSYHRLIAELALPHVENLLNQCSDAAGSRLLISHPPGSRKGRQQRGYDHMALICKSLRKLMVRKGYSAFKYARLFKRLAGPQQKELNREQRLISAQRQIILRKGVEDVDRLCESKRETLVFLLDDVVTTGATFGRCRELLLAADYSKMVCIGIAQD